MSSSDTVRQPDWSSESSSTTLTHADVLEIKKFAESKILSSRPDVQPFEGFLRVDEGREKWDNRTSSVDAIPGVWNDLEGRLELVSEWQDERDTIEIEAANFEIGDMERLRKVAKAASERDMSPQDTDLIEITMQTLLALDALLRLLKSRREALDLLERRLRWEQKRKDCWTSYISLSQDLDDFVEQSQWSPRVYQKQYAEDQSLTADADDSTFRSTSLADCSPMTEKSFTGITLTSTSAARRQGAVLKTQARLLSIRCHSFVNDLVPISGKELDVLIERRKVPEAFLDEQDRLEDLAESIKGREIFLIQLTLQWRKADDLYRMLRSLHIESKVLNTSILTAQKEFPTRERLETFQAQCEKVKRKLDLICNADCVTQYIDSQTNSLRSPQLSLQNTLPEPQCDRWPGQKALTQEVLGALRKELHVVAKHVRQACHSSSKYRRVLQSFDRLATLVDKLNNDTHLLEGVTRKACRGWSEETDGVKSPHVEKNGLPSSSSTLSFVEDLRAPDIDDIRCLEAGTFDFYINNFPKLEQQLGDVESEASQKVDEMGSAIRDCIKEGFSVSLFQRDADMTIYKFGRAKEDAKTAISAGNEMIELVRNARHLASQITIWRLEGDAVLEEVNSVIAARSLDFGGRADPPKGRLQAQHVALQQKNEEISAAFLSFSYRFKEREASKVFDVLNEHKCAMQVSMENISRAVIQMLEEAHPYVSEDHAPSMGHIDVEMGLDTKIEAESAGAGIDPVPRTRELGVTSTGEGVEEGKEAVMEAAEVVDLERKGLQQSTILQMDKNDDLQQQVQQESNYVKEADERQSKTPRGNVASIYGGKNMIVELEDKAQSLRNGSEDEGQRLIAMKGRGVVEQEGEASEESPPTGEAAGTEVEQTIEEVREPFAETDGDRHVSEDGANQQPPFQESGRDLIPRKTRRGDSTNNGRSQPVEEDVFGSLSMKRSSPPLARTRQSISTTNRKEVKSKVEQLLSLCSSNVVEEQTQPSGKLQLQNGLPLPTFAEAELIKRDWASTKKIVDTLLNPDVVRDGLAVDYIHMILQVRDANVQRFIDLAAFGAQQAVTEEALSNFLNMLDRAEEHRREENLDHRLAALTLIMTEANEVAVTVSTDIRVRHQLNQLRHSFQDMVAMKQEMEASPENLLDRKAISPVASSPTSTVSSLPSFNGSHSEDDHYNGHDNVFAARSTSKPSFESKSDHVFAIPALPSSSTMPRMRSQSSSSGTYITAPQSTPRQKDDRRVVSDGKSLQTPSRLPVSKSRSKIEQIAPLRPSTSSNSLTTPSGSSSKIPLFHTPRTPQNLSWPAHRRYQSEAVDSQTTKVMSTTSSAAKGAVPERRSSSSSSAMKPNRYRANPESKLDVAVAKIVNKLPIQVSITHASVTEKKTIAKDQWEDESGRYWVGHPEPKLCFCRILRSRTVMIRIGGGWQELSTYILKHYAHLATAPSETALIVSPSPHASPQLDRRRNSTTVPWMNASNTTTMLNTPNAKTHVFTAEFSPESVSVLTPLPGQEMIRTSFSPNSKGIDGTMSRSLSSSASALPLQSTDLDLEEARRSPEVAQGQRLQSEDPLHHSRSTASSRNRIIRRTSVEPRRRVESLTSKHGSFPTRVRVNSTASSTTFASERVNTTMASHRSRLDSRASLTTAVETARKASMNRIRIDSKASSTVAESARLIAKSRYSTSK
ncbi:hypothetical protein CBS101457_004324 [Exobasidium rhododendri]|nr:hypothetical protein CBS101457_004324 [Exobasidium rhododendri]